jgi:hypothetical protein
MPTPLTKQKEAPVLVLAQDLLLVQAWDVFVLQCFVDMHLYEVVCVYACLTYAHSGTKDSKVISSQDEA